MFWCRCSAAVPLFCCCGANAALRVTAYVLQTAACSADGGVAHAERQLEASTLGRAQAQPHGVVEEVHARRHRRAARARARVLLPLVGYRYPHHHGRRRRRRRRVTVSQSVLCKCERSHQCCCSVFTIKRWGGSAAVPTALAPQLQSLAQPPSHRPGPLSREGPAWTAGGDRARRRTRR